MREGSGMTVRLRGLPPVVAALVAFVALCSACTAASRGQSSRVVDTVTRMAMGVAPG